MTWSVSESKREGKKESAGKKQTKSGREGGELRGVFFSILRQFRDGDVYRTYVP